MVRLPTTQIEDWEESLPPPEGVLQMAAQSPSARSTKYNTNP